MDIHLPVTNIRQFFLGLWATVVAAGLVSVVAECVMYSDNEFLIQLLGVAYEQNLPTWYVSCLLALCSLLLLMISISEEKQQSAYARHWLILGLGFLYISCDESAMIHEQCFNGLNSTGIFYYGWVIPGAIVVAIFGAAFLPFLGQLPDRTRNRFVVAGFVYVGGALCLDMVCGYLHEQSGTDTLLYGMVDLTEEACEFLGVTLFLLALLDYLHPNAETLSFSIQRVETSPDQAGSNDLAADQSRSSAAVAPLQTGEMVGELPVEGLHH